ncbi:hypothetical protein LOK49_LG01G02442 [Camellia lanceoleosa]|uniref:Uncharacterized protein n=1 Tax=Camellia lanceoleosa TaxID=1840588 RepID=A0ACC0IVR9_9ERIC|nr:hypothetical protein LOK49_LG01G02442 [Camellia lanceoleosa]
MILLNQHTSFDPYFDHSVGMVLQWYGMHRYGSAMVLLYILSGMHRYASAMVLQRVGDALLMDLRDTHNPCCVYSEVFSVLPIAVEEQNFLEKSCRVHDPDEIFNVAASALLLLP